MPVHSYHTTEKLKSRKLLKTLFAEGRSFSTFPLKVFYLHRPFDGEAVQVGVGAGARHFKKAVDRNRIKRLLREGYRLNKTPLHDAVAGKERSLSVFFLYIGKELPLFDEIDQKMRTALQQLVKQIG